MKTKFKEYGLPCPCGKSSDAFAVNEDGSSKCYSCGKFYPGKNNRKEDEFSDSRHEVLMDTRRRQNTAADMMSREVKFMFANSRGVTRDVYEFFGCRMAVDARTSEPLFIQFPSPNGRTLNKSLGDKAFWWEGEKKDEVTGSLFGMDKFAPGGKIVTLTEGALDACSVYQMFGKQYPAVAITSAQSAKKECSEEENYKFLNSFDKIYLCLDSDGPGREAAKAVARLFDFNKVYVVQLQRKDANEYLEAKEENLFQKLWWGARRFVPEGILTTYSDIDKVIDDDVLKPSVQYPFDTLQSMTYGARTGELVLFTAQEGIGKTEIFRALEYHFLKNTDENVGIIHLEENKARTVKGLVGYEVQAPIHLPDFAIPKEEIKRKFRELTKKDERVHIYSHFGSDDPDSILDTVRFLAGPCECKRIFMDHITMVVTGLAGDDERRALDYISTRLAMMVEELDFTLFLISHVNDEGQTRGSRNIGKIADLRIDMHRDLKSENEIERNTTYLTVSKNRFAGKTGPAGRLWFNPETYVLKETNDDPDIPF